MRIGGALSPRQISIIRDSGFEWASTWARPRRADRATAQ
jgi:hypothetical protein